MKKLVLAALSVALLALAGCGLSPQGFCEQRVDGECEKMWNCPGASGLKIGSDLGSCKSQYKSLCALVSGCADGKTFDAAAASSCITDRKAQTCEQAVMGEPASCANSCK
ncbi:MAG: hypothetical protein IT380_13140 [Myxococcales bacterium]|nr:hypothetical protein [Myxococcales bacterium]